MLEYMKLVAKRAGALALADRALMTESSIHTKGTELDLVTDTDRKVEQYIISALRERFPDCGVYGEETGKSGMDRECCFIIDPIDGTTSFIHNLPNWCVSIGLVRDGEPCAGVVYAPASDELYYAQKGRGAFLNGMPVKVSKRGTLAESVAVTGFSCLRAKWTEETNLKFFSRIAPRLADIRKYGSAALDCCLVARGSVDAFWEVFLQPYDIAAGVVIAMEAGAAVTDFYGGSNYPDAGLICSNGLLHDKMLEFFSDFKNLKR